MQLNTTPQNYPELVASRWYKYGDKSSAHEQPVT